jgi:hypothetical protein
MGLSNWRFEFFFIIIFSEFKQFICNFHLSWTWFLHITLKCLLFQVVNFVLEPKCRDPQNDLAKFV